MIPCALLLSLLALPARAQVDPDRRRLVQFGYDQNFSGPGPTGAYIFYYMNQPNYPSQGMNLRIALAPVYLDSELAIKGALGEHTDVGLGIAGGGFADGYAEVHQGHYARDESFYGHGGKATVSAYHLFDPGEEIPLNGVLQGIVSGSEYMKESQTAQTFALPPDGLTYHLLTGLRLGGQPPRLLPGEAGEISVWNELRRRDHYGAYGYGGDRALNEWTDLYWSRLLFDYRLKSGKYYKATIEAGGSGGADRLNTFRLGGFLPFASQFPLSIPGYFNGEISARRYVLFNGLFEQPLNDRKTWNADVFAAAGNTSYLPGLGQPGPWNEGVGAGLMYESPGDVYKIGGGLARGFDAIRSGSRGAYSGILLGQLDFEAWRKRKAPTERRRFSPAKPEGLDWLFEILRP